MSLSTGTIKHYNAERGYGFIKQDNGGDDLFVHVSGVEEGSVLSAGKRVQYKEEPGRKGPQAAEVSEI